MDFHVVTVDQLTAHLRALRKARGLTQAGLGRLIGVSQSRVADIERDPGAISVAQMHKILAALGGQLYLRDAGGGWLSQAKNAAAPLTAKGKLKTGDAAAKKAAVPPGKKPGSW